MLQTSPSGNSTTLRNQTNNINQSDEVNSLKNDLHLIGQNVFKLNNNLSKILAKNEQRKSNEKKEKQKNLLHIKQNIGNNLRFLNEKFNSLLSTNIDNQLAPVLNDVIRNPELAKNAQLLNDKLNLVIKLNKCSNDFILDVGSDHNHLEIKLKSIEALNKEKIDKLKTIFYKRYKAKLKEFFAKLKLKYQNHLENYQQRNNFQFKLREYSKHCAKSNKPKQELRVLYREKLQDNLKFKYYFKILLLKYKKDVFKLVLNVSKRYIPRLNLFNDCLSHDRQDNLYMDKDQLELIYQFVVSTA
ncbi:unnamed protein product [Didymodactylos carnosus]|uniref:Uncharacterized protein n=1 Tax=Didymodactylos carnosus TaxID=1234261 RepID=A0A815RFD7_9BILA|nr:unnamed protein product [Didymodactylos carnosus]CAF4342151.1 unnamed protein product [Didymodactylos carnosus]